MKSLNERHEEFLAGLMSERDFDEIDEAMADPILDHVPQTRPKHKAGNVLRILDQLESGNANRRFTH